MKIKLKHIFLMLLIMAFIFFNISTFTSDDGTLLRDVFKPIFIILDVVILIILIVIKWDKYIWPFFRYTANITIIKFKYKEND